MRRNRRSGSALLETALFLPVILLLLVGTIELGKVTIIYFSLQKMMTNVARFAGTQQGANFCDDQDAVVSLAKRIALTGSPDGEGEPLIVNLTAEQIQVRLERYSADTGALNECACSVDGCDSGAGALSPDFIVVSIPDGYTVRPVFPLFSVDPIPLRPRVRVPFGGT